MDGADNGTTFTDSSPSGKTVSNTGIVTKTGVKKFGTASAYRTGATTSNRLSVPDTSDLYANKKFAISVWCYFTDITTSTAQRRTILFYGRNDTGVNYYFWYDTNQTPDHLTCLFGCNNAHPIYLDYAIGLSINTWYHIEVDIIYPNAIMFLDGLKVAEVTIDANYSAKINANELLYITTRKLNATSYDCRYWGYMDSLEIHQGKYLHKSNFTPPNRAA